MNYIIIENDTPENNSKIKKVNEHVRNNKHIVIYFYKDGCPFCEKTTPEWDNLFNYLPTINDLLLLRINKLLYEKLQSIGEKPMLYPHIRYIHGSHIDSFKKEGDERNSKNISIWIQQHNISKKQPTTFISQIKKPKYKKSIKKRKRNNFSKKRRQYYM